MSKKKKDLRVLSNKTCIEPGCNRPLKQNLVDKNPDATRCYTCYMRVIRKNPRYGANVKIPLRRSKVHNIKDRKVG